jgi:putative toxin-antitoxin system antitoxin component (TIGR02293 family)
MMSTAIFAKKNTVNDLLANIKRSKKRSYRVFAVADAHVQIDTVRRGIPAQFLSVLAADMHVSKEQLFDWTNIPRATANRKIAADSSLSVEESERAFSVAKLIGQAATMVGDAGDTDTAARFDAATWTAQWLQQPNNALGGVAPGEYLDTAEGRALIAQLLAQMQSGAYA